MTETTELMCWACWHHHPESQSCAEAEQDRVPTILTDFERGQRAGLWEAAMWLDDAIGRMPVGSKEASWARETSGFLKQLGRRP